LPAALPRRLASESEHDPEEDEDEEKVAGPYGLWRAIPDAVSY
jgi:hypothetical protein